MGIEISGQFMAQAVLSMQSAEIDQISKALCKAQSQFTTGIPKTGYNAHHKFYYVELCKICETARPILFDNNLSITDSVLNTRWAREGAGTGKDPMYVEVTMRHVLRHGPSGQWIASDSVAWGANRDKAPQSAQMQARKQGWQALLGLGGDEEEPVDLTPMVTTNRQEDFEEGMAALQGDHPKQIGTPEENPARREGRDDSPLTKDDKENLRYFARERCKELQVSEKDWIPTIIRESIRSAGFKSSVDCIRQDLQKIMREINAWETPPPEDPQAPAAEPDGDIPF